MEDWAKLIHAVAALLWPILVFVVVCIFRGQIQDILGRLRRGKLLGQEIELEKSLQKLDESAQAIASQTPNLIQFLARSSELSSQETEPTDFVRQVLDEASRSPKVALLLLASELEREVRQLLASMGLLGESRPTSLLHAVQTFEERGALPRHLAESVRSFWDIRNRLVHGYAASQDDILRAIDSGLTILQAIKAIPHEIHSVYHPGVEVYSDSEGKNLREGVKGVVLETTGPEGLSRRLQVFPTTRTHFQKGKKVAWEWNSSRVFDESWYKHPDTGKVTYGWSASMEFVGRHLEDI